VSLSSLQLDAFLEVARTGNFSRAARNLRLTQPALSQRIRNLESELEAILFVRDPSGVQLTERGEALLRYGLTRESLEAELLAEWKGGNANALGGMLRIGGFSTIVRSIVMPALQRLLERNPAVQLDLKTRELRDLPGLLRRGEVDFLIADRTIRHKGWIARPLGHESNVLVESAVRPIAPDSYLDHDPEDATTLAFFRLNKKDDLALRRSYLDEIYAVLDGVAAGWGRAVVPEHLARGRSDLRIVPGYRALRIPVILHTYRQPVYSKLHQHGLEALLGAAKGLS
jgi:DNA-binding transcriptional LysR family regulator